ncbi:MAG: polyprenol phosphomannose-dependent alpha 1,6 mannosyltransferase MptB, partial [Actinoallomurus sp.]
MRRTLPYAALTGIAVSLALMVLVGLCRFPAAVPPMGGDGVFPRLTWPYASDLWATGLLWTAMIIGFAGLAAGLVAVRDGWRPRGLVGGGLIAVAVLVAAPPMGTTDTMDYVVYGRMAVLGYDPQVMTPREFRATGDQVGALAPEPWQDTPSVYGPLATGTEWAAAALPGGSAVSAVFWLKMWNALAFLAAALALVRLTGPDRARRARVHLLWTLNPLLLWALIGGAHVDGLAAGLAVAGLATAGPAMWRSGAAGMLIGGAAAVKAPYLLIGAALAWSLR